MTEQKVRVLGNLIRMLSELGILNNFFITFIDIAPYQWDPSANGGVGGELPHSPDWQMRVERKQS
jgi:hypothetical protein